MILYLLLDCTLIFKESVNLVLTDKVFDIHTFYTNKKNALLCAQQVLTSMSDSSGNSSDDLVKSFSADLLKLLKGCFVASSFSRRGRDKMWEKLYKIQSSTEFKEMWAKFNLTGDVAHPIFYQFVTNKILAQLIKSMFIKSKEPRTDIVESQPLDYMAANAIRYIAGYTVLALRKKLNRSSHPLKESIILCLKILKRK